MFKQKLDGKSSLVWGYVTPPTVVVVGGVKNVVVFVCLFFFSLFFNLQHYNIVDWDFRNAKIFFSKKNSLHYEKMHGLHGNH